MKYKIQSRDQLKCLSGLKSSNLQIFQSSNQSAFTLIEILLAIAIISFVIAAIAPFIKTTYNSWEKDTRLTKILQRGREAMDKMVKELQEAPNLNLSFALDSTTTQYKVADIVVDDGNSGYEESGTWTKYSGTGQGADSREGTGGAGYSRWRVPIIVPGNYEIYVFYNAAAGRPAALTYTINSADVGSPLTSDAVNQTTNGGKWVRITDNAGAKTTFTFNAGVTGYIQIANTNLASVDAIKLVYKSSSYKQFKFDAASNPDELKWGYNNGAENLFTLCDNIDAGNSSFTFFKIDNTVAATAGEVALIKIKLTLTDPQNKVSPISLYGEVAVRNDNLRNVVINEVFYNPPQRTLTSYANWDWRTNAEPTRVETDNGAACNSFGSITYSAAWTRVAFASDSGGAVCHNNGAASTLRFAFTGTGVAVVIRTATSYGMGKWVLQRSADSSIAAAGVIDNYYTATTYQVVYPIAYGLPNDNYWLTIKYLNARVDRSTGVNIYIDAFDYWTNVAPSFGMWSQSGNTFYDNFETGDGFASNYQYNIAGALNAYATTWSTTTVGGGATCNWEQGWVDNGYNNKPSTRAGNNVPPETNNGSYWVTDLDAQYPNNCDQAVISPTFKLGNNPKMFFKHWWRFDSANNDADCMGTVIPLTGDRDLCSDGGGLVQISTDGGITWTQLFPEGSDLDWPRTGSGDECGATHCTNGYPNQIPNPDTTNLASGTWVYGARNDRLDTATPSATPIRRTWTHSYFDLTNNDDDPSVNPPNPVSYANQTVKIRFYSSTGNNRDEGWVIENFVLSDDTYATFRLEAEDADLQTQGVITYAGANWSTPATTSTDSDGADQGADGTVRRNANTNNTDTVTIKFVGTGVYVTERRGADQGIYQWQIDGGGWTTVDQYRAGATAYQVTRLITEGLAYTTHTIVIKTTNTKNAASTSNQVYFDGFDVQRPSQYFRKFWELGKPGPAGYYTFGPTDDNTAGANYGYAFGTQIDHNYLNNLDYSLVSPTLDISAVATPIMMTWYQYADILEGQDGVTVDYSIDGGTNWTQVPTSSVEYDAQIPTGRLNPIESLWAFSFNDAAWTQKVADLSVLAGQANCKIRFRFGSGFGINSAERSPDEAGVKPGYYIDDIQIVRGGGDNILEAIELYNLSTQDIDVNNWTIQTSTGSDTISNGCGSCSATTTIPSGGYATIVDSDSYFYNACPAGSIGYSCIIPGGAIKLSLSGAGSAAFGSSGLVNTYDQLTLENSVSKVIDYMGYNLVFVDTLDSADANYWKTNYSRTITDPENLAGANNCNSDEFGGDEVVFSWGTPLAGVGPGVDHTSGTGQVWATNMGTGRNCVNSGGALVLPPINLKNITTPYFYYWQYNDTYRAEPGRSRLREGYIVEESTVGGQPSDVSGQWSQIDTVTPYYTTGSTGPLTINRDHSNTGYIWGKRAFADDAKYWRRIKVNLNAWVNQVIRLRFYYETTNVDNMQDADCAIPWLPNADIVDRSCIYQVGLYLDDFLVTGSWGGAEGFSLERKCPRGFSNSPLNWGQSTDADGLTPGDINALTTTAGCN